MKSTAPRRRDERNAKIEPRRQSGSSKDTKRWCGGKVGREHQKKCVKFDEVKKIRGGDVLHPHWRILLCTVCGKELANYWPWKARGFKDRPAPAWVDC